MIDVNVNNNLKIRGKTMNFKKCFLVIVVIMISIVFASASPSMAAQKEFIAIATGGTAGTYYPLGGALAQAISTKLKDVIVTAQSGNASIANINLIKQHEIETAFVQNNTAYDAYNGVAQFEGNAVKNIRVIASLYPEAVQIVALKSANIKSVADLKGKRVIPGDMGSGTAIDAGNVVSVYGITFEDFGQLDWLSFAGVAQRLKDNQADAGFVTAGLPTAALLELASNTPVSIVPISDDMNEALAKKWPFYAKVIIPGGTYSGMPEDIATTAVMAQWVVDEDVSEELVYKLTRALWESGGDKDLSGAEIMAQTHSKGKEITLKTALLGVAIPLHSGAEKYYKEKGIIK